MAGSACGEARRGNLKLVRRMKWPELEILLRLTMGMQGCRSKCAVMSAIGGASLYS